MSQTQGLYNHPWAAKDQARGGLKRWCLGSGAGALQGCGECGLGYKEGGLGSFFAALSFDSPLLAGCCSCLDFCCV